MTPPYASLLYHILRLDSPVKGVPYFNSDNTSPNIVALECGQQMVVSEPDDMKPVYVQFTVSFLMHTVYAALEGKMDQ